MTNWGPLKNAKEEKDVPLPSIRSVSFWTLPLKTCFASSVYLFLPRSTSLPANINLNLQIILKKCYIYRYINQLFQQTAILQSVLWEYTCHPVTRHRIYAVVMIVSLTWYIGLSHWRGKVGLLINVLEESVLRSLPYCCLPPWPCSRFTISIRLWWLKKIPSPPFCPSQYLWS